MRFPTHDKFRFSHCAFVIDTTNNTYVFDPTGVQFGPDWALVSHFHVYKALRIKRWKDVSCDPLL